MLPLQPGSEERKAGQHRHIETEREEKANRKIKIILFGSSKKIPTFALPTETKGKQKKDQVADVTAINRKD